MPYKTVEADKAYRLLYPSITTVITSSWGRLDDATPATSCTPLSFRPALFGVSISPTNFIHHLIQRSGSFAINLLSAENIRATAKAGDISRRFNSQKVKDSGFSLKEARNLDARVLKEAFGVIECSLERILHTGDHDLFVGRFKTAYAKEDFREYWKYDDYSPIIYAGSTPNGMKHRFSRISKRFIEIPYTRDGAKEEYFQKAIRIVQGVTDKQELDRRSAVKLLAKKLNLRILDSKYLVDHLIQRERLQLKPRSKTSY